MKLEDIRKINTAIAKGQAEGSEFFVRVDISGYLLVDPQGDDTDIVGDILDRFQEYGLAEIIGVSIVQERQFNHRQLEPPDRRKRRAGAGGEDERAGL